MHADMWADRLRDEARFRSAVDELWPSALGLLEPGQRDRLCEILSREPVDPVERGEHTEELRPLWEEMTMVRRSVPRSEEHTSELQSRPQLVCRLLLAKKKRPGAALRCRHRRRVRRHRGVLAALAAPVALHRALG